MKFYEWIKNNEIDNRELTLGEWKDKFLEETSEVIEALDDYLETPTLGTFTHLWEELFDVIQLIILIRFILKERKTFSEKLLKNCHEMHECKRIDRGWTKGQVIEITIKDRKDSFEI